MSPTFSLLGHKSPPAIEAKVVVGKVGKEERKGAAQEKKVPGIRDKEEKKGAKTPGKEVCAGVVCALDGRGGRRGKLSESLQESLWREHTSLRSCLG